MGMKKKKRGDVRSKQEARKRKSMCVVLTRRLAGKWAGGSSEYHAVGLHTEECGRGLEEKEKEGFGDLQGVDGAAVCALPRSQWDRESGGVWE